MSESVREIVNAAESTEPARTSESLAYDEKLTLSWIDVGLQVKPEKPKWWTKLFSPSKMKAWKEDEGRQLLYGIIGKVEPGEIVGIMGESGSGKSLLLKILAGRIAYGHPVGMIKVNGCERVAKGWNRFVCFLDQEDVLDCELTVFEMTSFAARIKLPSIKFSDEEKDRIAERLVEALNLKERRDSKIKSLSAGELRRVSIAVELAAERHLLLMDEPTSGLDSKLALDLIRIIRNLAHLYDLSVIIVAHQPRSSILELFDKLLLISRGTTVFYGRLNEAIRHFEQVTGNKRDVNENPGDYLMDCISMNRLNRTTRLKSEESIGKLQIAWKSIEADSMSSGSKQQLSLSRAESFARRRQSVTSRFFHTATQSTKQAWPVSRFLEFRLLLHRYIRDEFRDWRICSMYLALFILLGLFYGFLYFQLTTENFGGFQSRLGTI